VTDKGMQDVAALPNLQRLNTWGRNISDKTLALLKDKNLVSLELDDTEVSDEGMKHLKGMTNMESLHLRRDFVGDPGVENIQNMKNSRPCICGIPL